MTLNRNVVVFALFVGSALGLRGSAGEHRAHLSDDLLGHRALHTTERTRVIVHGDAETVDALAARHHVTVLNRLPGGAVLAANSAEVAELAADSSIDHLSGDPLMTTSMLVSNKSTAADQVWAGVPGLFGIGAIKGVNGQGIGVAVIDSGISAHAALLNAALQTKVVANVSLIADDPSVADAFGHGTHVAGIIAGNNTAAKTVTGLYTGGIAPGVQLVNIRVLGANGVGRTSDVINGIQWAIDHRAQYNIRVINLSIGHPVMESATTDPLCEEVAKAVQAGIVVVAAAGNAGVDANGAHVLGGIVSPGNSPWAITVGALNTWSTVSRSDDTVTTYSSRGPTRYDKAVKPDVGAPGNKIISLEASGAALPSMYSYLHKAGTGTNSYMQLSGTSMAAPMVSGGVALLLQGTPSMVPSQVKLALQTGATYVADGGLMGAGAGSVNFWSSRKIAASGLTALTSSLIGGVLSPSSGAAFWDAGTLAQRLYDGNGLRFLSILQAPLYWLNPSLLNFGDLNLFGLGNPLASIAAKSLLYGQIGAWTSSQSIMWGDAIYDPNGQSIMWGDSHTSDGTSIMWGDSMTAPDPR
jgi:subtilisin family serine protease